MKFTAQQISTAVGGTLKGDAGAIVTGAAALDQAGPTDLSFLKSGRDTRLVQLFEKSRASVVIVPAGFNAAGRTVIEVAHPMQAFTKLLSLAQQEKKQPAPGVHPTAIVAPSAKLGRNISVGPYVVVDDLAEIGDNTILMSHVHVGWRSKVGADTLLYPHVVVREDVRVGARCVVHSGTIIGSDGFGFFFANGQHNKIPQIGLVEIGDDVEIGSNVTIDRAMMGVTRIGKGVKIDNLVQIGHNVEVGEHTLVVAQVGIAGSSKIGKNSVLAGQVGVSDHVTLGDNVQVGAQSGVKDDFPSGSILFGTPAQPIQETMRQTALVRRLPEFFKTLKKLKETFSPND